MPIALSRSSALYLTLAVLVSPVALASSPVFIVSSPPGLPTFCASPVSTAFELSESSQVQSFRLVELDRAAPSQSEEIVAQFEPEAPGARRGTLWSLLPPATARERRFRLSSTTQAALARVTISADPAKSSYDFRDGALPVLRYNHGTVPVPDGIPTNYARGDYIMPLFGPHGESLADDYPKDHPHHRGVGWSWPVTRWGNEVRDIWAVVGVWSRPAAVRRIEAGPVFALLEAENVWKWGDTNSIVREEVLIRAFRQGEGTRFVDVEVRLTALADGVAIGGRPHGGYGGFGLRAQPAQQRVITGFTDPTNAVSRRSWLDYSGVFAGGQGPAGLAIFEHPANPFYPNEFKEYPDLNYVMPAFPGEREVALSREKPLVLRHRLWTHEGMATPDQLAAVWAAYANPPQARMEKK